MLPTIKELIMYANKVLDGIAWNTNWQKIVNWLTSGKYSLKVKELEIAQDGGLVNNGSLTQNGNLSVDGDVDVEGNLNVNGILSGDGSGLTGIISSAQVAYTPFCVNSGTTDANGNGDLFNYSVGVSTSIEFKVGDGTSYKPITFTNARGRTITLEQVNSYDLSQTDDGTYIVYITANATAVTLTDNGRTIFRQPYAPTVAQNPQPSDIWLDTSKEGLVSYIRQSGTWEETDLVPLGEVTVSSHTISSATTYYYNNNGYDVHVIEEYKNGDDWYRIWSNGMCEQAGKVTTSGTDTATKTVTFLVEMQTILFGYANPINSAVVNATLTSISGTAMVVSVANRESNGTASTTSYWYICGYKK